TLMANFMPGFGLLTKAGIVYATSAGEAMTAYQAVASRDDDRPPRTGLLGRPKPYGVRPFRLQLRKGQYGLEHEDGSDCLGVWLFALSQSQYLLLQSAWQDYDNGTWRDLPKVLETD